MTPSRRFGQFHTREGGCPNRHYAREDGSTAATLGRAVVPTAATLGRAVVPTAAKRSIVVPTAACVRYTYPAFWASWMATMEKVRPVAATLS